MLFNAIIMFTYFMYIYVRLSHILNIMLCYVMFNLPICWRESGL